MAFYSKQDPMELVWVVASLNMSERDKRASVHLCVPVCADVLFVYKPVTLHQI